MNRPGKSVYSLAAVLAKRWLTLKVLFFCIVLLSIGVELYPKVSKLISDSSKYDEMYHSYKFVEEMNPEKIYYSGYVPYIELKLLGCEIQEIPEKWLSDRSVGFLNSLQPGEVLVVDGSSLQNIDLSSKKDLNLIWKSEDGYGQHIFKCTDEN